LTPAELAQHLANRGTFSYSRASGPGGQRRDHVETRVQLTIGMDATEGLPPPIAERVIEQLRLDRGPQQIISGRDRSRERNRAAVLDQLARRVVPALRPPPPPRRTTRPTRAAKQRRVETKQRRGITKRLRRPPSRDD
jgi:ribosome-associated protein